MIKKLLVLITLHVIGVTTTSFGQDLNLQAIALDTVLTSNANAVIRSYDMVVEVNSTNAITVKKKLVVTILNEKGKSAATTYGFYDSGTKIKKQEAIIYDAFGVEIKKYKKGDFEDQSVSDGFSLITDTRVRYIDHTPANYPYTVFYESELAYSSSIFIPSWSPMSDYKTSVEKATYQFLNPSKIPFRHKESSFSAFGIKRAHTEHQLNYVLEHAPAILKESHSVPLIAKVPRVRVALDHFSLFGVKGKGKDWSSFGKWQYDNLVVGKGALPEATIKEVKALLEDSNTTVEKVKQVYQYVQGKTRYVGVQLGIGGWIPMAASAVDRLGYGDCKALTNYTKALLESQGIPAYYSVVYGDQSKKSIDSSFVAMQGNHVILNVPDGKNEMWLECTDQDAPFNFIAGFTDDRDVLVLTPEGGVIKHTKKYSTSENTLDTKAVIAIHENQSISAKVIMESKGMQYARRYRIPKKDTRDRELHYKNYWNYLNGIQLTLLDFQNDKEQIVFTEKINLNLMRYASKAGNRLLINPNFFNREYSSLPKYEDRKTPLVIARGFIDTDVYEIKLPQGYEVFEPQDSKKIETPFGVYESSVTRANNQTLLYSRKLQINEGVFSKKAYEVYRQFREQIKKIDQTKIVLNKQ